VTQGGLCLRQLRLQPRLLRPQRVVHGLQLTLLFLQSKHTSH
jgi:hypothetical protein